MITFDDVYEGLKIMKSSYDLGEDISFYYENIEVIKRNNFNELKDRLNKSIERYKQSINALSIFTNVKIVKYEELDYNTVYKSLVYLTNNIPFYIAVDKLKDKGFEFILNKLFQGK